MEFNCTLTITRDQEALYEDDYYYNGPRKVSASVGGNELMLRTVERLNYWVAKYDQCYREELVILGLHLYNIAFCTPNILPGAQGDPLPLKTAFESTYEAFEKRRENEADTRLRLMLVLHRAAERLAVFPWEFIFIPRGEDGFFLAGQQTDLILTRFVPGADAAHAFQTDQGREKLRILIVLSKPKELGIVDAEDLIKEIMELQPQHITVERLDQPHRRMLCEKITTFKPHIMHFIGHGKEGGLALMKEADALGEAQAENESRKARGQEPLPIEEADWLDSKSVSGLFDDYKPRLVFLHACNGAAPDLLARSLRSFSSTARELAYSKIPAVIAMQYEISNADAQRFARKFYNQIRQGKRIGEAVKEARRELGKFSTKGRNEWDDRSFGTPVIYLQSEKAIIDPPPTDAEGAEPGMSTTTVTMQRVLCPYPDCTGGMVIPGRRLCLTCKRPLVLCPACKSVMAQAIGLCDNCGYEEGASAPAARAMAPQPVTTAAPAAPAQPALLQGGYDVTASDSRESRIA